MLHTNLGKNVGFRELNLREIEAVSGGTDSPAGGTPRPSVRLPVNVDIQVDVNELIDQVGGWCLYPGCGEDNVNSIVNEVIDRGAQTILLGTDDNGRELRLITGTNYIVKDSDGNHEFDQIWQDVSAIPGFPDWRMFDGTKWVFPGTEPWHKDGGLDSVFDTIGSSLAA